MTDIVTPPTISALPPAPLATDTPTEFDAKAFAMVAAQVGFVPQANALASNVFGNATAAFERTAIAQAAALTATTQADAAMGYRNQAGNSATAAAGSATNAAASATTSLGAYTQLQALYLGSKTSIPTTDNQGNPLQTGAMYTNIGTNPALKNRGWWWDGTTWQLAWGEFTGSYMPVTGGNFLGHISVPTGATGAQVPRADAVTLRAATTYTKSALMADAPLGVWAGYETDSGDGADWPPTGGSIFSWWNVITFGIAGRKSQMAIQALGISPVKGAVFVRGQQDSTWSAWQRLLGDQSMIERVVTAVQSGSTYAPDPAAGTLHQLTVNAACTISPVTPRLGDQFTIKAQFSGGAWPLTFAANIKPPLGSLPEYAANQILPIIFECSRAGIWDMSFGQVRAV
ncbi:hypothetical protein [Delftia acidovorans]|uniref:hypothetical protein n=1 Tax=Delftia acidovorans TaxID=80866 RepID=UPI00301AA47B